MPLCRRIADGLSKLEQILFVGHQQPSLGEGYYSRNMISQKRFADDSVIERATAANFEQFIAESEP